MALELEERDINLIILVALISMILYSISIHQYYQVSNQ